MQNEQYKTILYQNYQDLNRVDDAWIFFYNKRGITSNNFIAVQLAVVVDPDLQIRGGGGGGVEKRGVRSQKKCFSVCSNNKGGLTLKAPLCLLPLNHCHSPLATLNCGNSFVQLLALGSHLH